MSYERRPVLGAYFEALAARKVLFEFGPMLEKFAQELASSSDELDQQTAREIRGSLSRCREVSRQLAARGVGVRVAPVSSERNGETNLDAPDAVSTRSGGPPPVHQTPLTPGEVAQQVELGVRRVQQLCKSGELRATRVGEGRPYLIQQADVDEYLDGRTG